MVLLLRILGVWYWNFLREKTADYPTMLRRTHLGNAENV